MALGCFFFSGSLLLFSKTEMLSSKESALTVVSKAAKYNKSQEKGSPFVSFPKQPTFQARHLLPTKTSTIIPHP